MERLLYRTVRLCAYIVASAIVGLTALVVGKQATSHTSAGPFDGPLATDYAHADVIPSDAGGNGGGGGGNPDSPGEDGSGDDDDG